MRKIILTSTILAGLFVGFFVPQADAQKLTRKQKKENALINIAQVSFEDKHPYRSCRQ